MKTQTLDVFQVIADPSRRQMLLMLSKDSMTINSLAGNFNMSRPAVSKHIKILYQAGFISVTGIGRHRYCMLKKTGFDELQHFINHFDKFWTNKLGRLQAILNSKVKMTGKDYKTTSYSVSMPIARTPAEVFTGLTDLKKWWPEKFDGEEIRLHSEFMLTTGDSHYSRNKVMEWVPMERLMWVATGAIRRTDGYDWTGAKFIFELTPEGGGTLVTFTYDGVVLKGEEDRLAMICNQTLRELFYNFVMNGAENSTQ